MHLSLAVIWIALGIGLIVWHWVDPEATRGKLGGLSMGWIALVLGVYNLARWWSLRSYQAVRQAEREARAERERRGREETKPDPDSPFKFNGP
jgi:hypothetical protein